MNNYEITKKLDNCKVHVKNFSGAKIKCMDDYAQPTIRTNPDHIVIHIGTNDLPSKKPRDNVDLALKLKSDTCQVSLSNLRTQSDEYRQKAFEVNQHLKTYVARKTPTLSIMGIIPLYVI